MTARTVLVAAPDLAVETDLVSALTGSREVGAVRRCVDAIDLLGVASTGAASIAIVGPHLPRAGVELIERLRALHVDVLGVVDSGDASGAAALSRWGIDQIRSIDADSLPDLVGALCARPDVVSSHDVSTSRDGRVIAVWGPHGAPGRTTVSLALADEVARTGASSMLIDADMCGGAVGIQLGMLEESSGLVAACRRAEQGLLDLNGLARSARTVGKGLRVLTGLDSPTLWTHVRPTSFTRVLAASRAAVGTTVVDVGFGIHEGGSPQGSAAVALAAIESSDIVIAVASADPVGLSRLAVSFGQLRDLAGVRPVVVVANRVVSSRRSGQREVQEALAALCGVHDAFLLPFDAAAPAAVRDGITLAESSPRCQLRGRIRELARHVAALETDPALLHAWSAA